MNPLDLLHHERKQGRPTLMAALLAAVIAVASLSGPSVYADGVSVVDPETGHRYRLPNHGEEGRRLPPRIRIDTGVVPGLTYPRNAPGEVRERRSSGGGSICHGDDGGTTTSTARRACNPSAPAGDGGARDAPSSFSTSPAPSAPTRPSSPSSTQLN